MTQQLDFRNVSQDITLDSVIPGFDPNDATTAAGRRSTAQYLLELLGVYVQYSTDGTTPSDTASANDTHFRFAIGGTKPGNSSSRWTAWVRLGSGGALSFADISGQIADSQIPASIMRDSEFTAAAVRGLLGLTDASEVNDLFTGATYCRAGTLTFTQNDGTTVPRLPSPLLRQARAMAWCRAACAIKQRSRPCQLTLDNGGTNYD